MRASASSLRSRDGAGGARTLPVERPALASFHLVQHASELSASRADHACRASTNIRIIDHRARRHDQPRRLGDPLPRASCPSVRPRDRRPRSPPSYTREQLYSIIADVDAYKTFVPYCTQSRVLSGKADGQAIDVARRSWLDAADRGDYALRASLSVGFVGFEEQYTSLVECRKFDQVRATAIESKLFRRLSTTWSLLPAPEGAVPPTQDGRPPAPATEATIVSIDLAFEFASMLHQMAAGPAFAAVSDKIMNGFVKRCRAVHGSAR